MDEEQRDNIVGKHVYANLYDIDLDLAANEEVMKAVVVKAVKEANANLHEVQAWKFGGKKGGVSVIALVLESHVAIHTWIEYNYATVDVYTCGDHTDPWKALKVIIEALKPKHYTVHYADRSQLPL
ncbi:MAG: adenosylmethionine decarboxylase [Acidilobaceae archaeon]|nr:adenosylmethionine decarboxylase [Acidilobaceae archaeon]MCX8166120.1 adenosylmethionine decarboxylase [Acidilobaceae archaeon]MDW7974763.1 adenosylmethionine decarboxylase [Sulfolobales archaeon]